MPDLKLAKLPDRTPVKISITVSPELNYELNAYAKLYQETYGTAETVPEMIPYMLEGFLESDRGFAKARKEKPIDIKPATRSPGHSGRSRRGDSPDSTSTAS